MIGAILGDIYGAPYEMNPVQEADIKISLDNSEFTDDTVMTIAIADVLMNNLDPTDTIREYFKRYPNAGYGERFHKWALSPDKKPYGSLGNGSAMRTAPVGWFYHDADTVMEKAAQLSRVTHDHPDAVNAAQAVALSIFLLRNGYSQKQLQIALGSFCNYTFPHSFKETNAKSFPTAQAIPSVPHAIHAFLVSESFEDAIFKAISLNADADTQACIAGALAEAHWGIEPQLAKQALDKLTPDLRAKATPFYEKFVLTLCK